MAGIYQIINKVTGKRYIGSTIGYVCRRLSGHRRDLIKGKHANKYLQYSFDKYGIDNFIFEKIEELASIKNQLLEKEQYYIDLYKTSEDQNGYNLRKIASSNVGLPCSEETRKKMSEAHKGLQRSEEHRKNLSKALTGKKLSPETIAKRTASRAGFKHSEEAKKKIGKSSKGRCVGELNPRFGKPGTFLGKKHTPETIEKIRQTKIKKGIIGGSNGIFAQGLA